MCLRHSPVIQCEDNVDNSHISLYHTHHEPVSVWHVIPALLACIITTVSVRDWSEEKQVVTGTIGYGFKAIEGVLRVLCLYFSCLNIHDQQHTCTASYLRSSLQVWWTCIQLCILSVRMPRIPTHTSINIHTYTQGIQDVTHFKCVILSLDLC